MNTNDYSVRAGNYSLSPGFLRDLLATTQGLVESLLEPRHRPLWNLLYSESLTDKLGGHIGRMHLIGDYALALVKASYNNFDENTDFPGVFEYEVPTLFWAALAKRGLDDIDLHDLCESVVSHWLHPDPDWEVITDTGRLLFAAPDVEAVLGHLRTSGVNIKTVNEIRQIPDGTD